MSSAWTVCADVFGFTSDHDEPDCLEKGKQQRLLHFWVGGHKKGGGGWVGWALCIYCRYCLLSITSSHTPWLMRRSPQHLFWKLHPFFFSIGGFKNDIWWQKLQPSSKPPNRRAAVWWLGNYHLSRPSQELFDTWRTKLACHSKPAKSIKCNRWFRDELTHQPLTLLKNYLECTF